jgi:hypothetical protein
MCTTGRGGLGLRRGTLLPLPMEVLPRVSCALIPRAEGIPALVTERTHSPSGHDGVGGSVDEPEFTVRTVAQQHAHERNEGGVMGWHPLQGAEDRDGVARTVFDAVAGWGRRHGGIKSFYVGHGAAPSVV